MQIFFACGPCQLLSVGASHLIQHKSLCLHGDLPGPAGLAPCFPQPFWPAAQVFLLIREHMGHPQAQGLGNHCSLYLKCSSSRMLQRWFFKPLFQSPFYKEGFWITLKVHILSSPKLHFPLLFFLLLSNYDKHIFMYLKYYQLLQVWHKLCDRGCHLGCSLHVSRAQLILCKYLFKGIKWMNLASGIIFPVH